MKTAPDATLMIISDHGFTSFDRAVNLNTWLYKEGFLAIDNPANLGKDDGTLTHVDWAHTQAYSIGLNSIYINVAGREKYGISGCPHYARSGGCENCLPSGSSEASS